MQDPSTAFQGIRPPPGAPQFPPPGQQEQHLKCPRCDSTNTKFCYYNNYNLSQPRHFCKSCRRYWTKGGALRNIPVGGGTRKNSAKRGGSGASSGARGGSNSNNNNNNNAGNSGAGAGGSGVGNSSSSGGVTGQQAKRPNSSVSVPAHLAAAAIPHHQEMPLLSYGPPGPMLHQLPAIYTAHPANQERQLLDMGGSFSSLLTSAGHYGGGLIDATAFHPVTVPGSMTLPAVTGGMELALLRQGDGHELTDHTAPQPQNPSSAGTVPGTSTAPDTYLGLHGYWDGDGGHDDGGVGGGDGTSASGEQWPIVSIYTRGSNF